jgi:hypothetical protein
MEYNVERAKVAINYLLTQKYYAQLWRKIVAASQKPNLNSFEGEQETLNELVLIGFQNKKALDNLYEVIKSHRSDKADYQREFMATKRRRDAKAVRVEELITNKKLSHEERRLFLLERYSSWNKGRDEVIAQYDELTWDQRNEIIKEYWVLIDQGLDLSISEFS